MSITTIYKNSFGSTISSEQASGMQEYEKLTYVNNQLKIIESFEFVDAASTTISYFMDVDENKNSLISQYTDANKNVSCLLYTNKQTTNSFSLWDQEHYSVNGVLAGRAKIAFDERDRIILIAPLNIDTNMPQSLSIKKFYGDDNSNPSGETLLEFGYSPDNTIDYVFDPQGYFGYGDTLRFDQFLDDIEFSQHAFPWDQHPYYHSITPYLPEGDL